MNSETKKKPSHEMKWEWTEYSSNIQKKNSVSSFSTGKQITCTLIMQRVKRAWVAVWTVVINIVTFFFLSCFSFRLSFCFIFFKVISETPTIRCCGSGFNAREKKSTHTVSGKWIWIWEPESLYHLTNWHTSEKMNVRIEVKRKSHNENEMKIHSSTGSGKILISCALFN